MPAARAHVYWSGTFDDRDRRSLVQPALPHALDSVLRDLAGEHLQDYLWFDQKYFLPDNILTKVDHTSMAHAVEVRPPFLDHRIVEFANSLPASMKIQGSRQKVILRNLMRGKLAPAILNRKKIGFDIPTHDWFRGPLRPLLEEAVAFASAEHHDFFQLSKIKADMQAHLDRRANLGYHLWGLMTTILLDEKMGNPDQSVGGAGAPRDGKRLHCYLIVLLVAAAVYAGCMISPPSLMDDVDAVQAQIARNMLTSGDYVTARLDGIPYLEKAPLIYWLIAGSFKIFGATDWAARIPMVLAALALAWLTTAFGMWAFGRRAGFYAGLCIATCFGLFLFTRILIPDVMLTASIALSMWAFLRAIDETEPQPALVGFRAGGQSRNQPVVQKPGGHRLSGVRRIDLPRHYPAIVSSQNLEGSSSDQRSAGDPADRRALAHPGNPAQSAVLSNSPCAARPASITGFCGFISSTSNCSDS